MMLGGSVHTVKENAETLIVAGKEIGLAVKVDKTEFMVVSGDHNAGRSNSMNTDTSIMPCQSVYRTFIYLALCECKLRVYLFL